MVKIKTSAEYTYDVMEENCPSQEDIWNEKRQPAIIWTHTADEIQGMDPEEICKLINSETMCPKSDVDVYIEDGTVIMAFDECFIFQNRKDMEDRGKRKFEMDDQLEIGKVEDWAYFAIEQNIESKNE